MDKELKQLRNNRWDKAFSGEVPVTEEEVDAAVNRKATIVVSTRLCMLVLRLVVPLLAINILLCHSSSKYLFHNTSWST